MKKCSVCNKPVILKTCFDKETLCTQCSKLLNVSLWNKREFDSIEDLLQTKEKVLNNAKINNINDNIVQSIDNFFNEYVKNGFITSIDGKAGQTLKIFEDYCIVNTKNQSKKNSLIDLFYYFDEDDNDESEKLSLENKMQLAENIINDGIIKVGINTIMSSKLKEEAQEENRIKKIRLIEKKLDKIIKVGEKKLSFKDYHMIEFFENQDTPNGYIKFVPNNINAEDTYKCEYFFFKNTKSFAGKKNKIKLEKIQTLIENKIFLNLNKTIKSEETDEIIPTENNPFDEIRKYKELLDENIISQEEFQKKKEELLKL